MLRSQQNTAQYLGLIYIHWSSLRIFRPPSRHLYIPPVLIPFLYPSSPPSLPLSHQSSFPPLSLQPSFPPYIPPVLLPSLYSSNLTLSTLIPSIFRPSLHPFPPFKPSSFPPSLPSIPFLPQSFLLPSIPFLPSILHPSLSLPLSYKSLDTHTVWQIFVKRRPQYASSRCPGGLEGTKEKFTSLPSLSPALTAFRQLSTFTAEIQAPASSRLATAS